ncbi:MAG: DsbA family protein [Nitrososphaerales archaeon]
MKTSSFLYQSLIVSIILFILGISASFAQMQMAGNITIKASLKDGNLQNIAMFADNRDQCPISDCVEKLEGTTFNGSALDKLLFGTVKVKDNANSDPNFVSYIYYKLAGSFHLASSKENVKTGEKSLFYNGTLGIDKNDVIFNPEFKFNSLIKLNQNNFELNGVSTQRNEIIQQRERELEIVKKLTVPVQENASALGDKDANITMIEFGDYQCQDCTKFHNETSGLIINDYVNTGVIKYVFKDFTINDKQNNNMSTVAARASYCAADQGKYWQYHNELYSNFQGENTEWITDKSLNQFARNINVTNSTMFSEYLDSKKYYDIVMENNQLAQAIGIKSTPTFILVRDGKEPLGIVGAQPFNVFQGAISQLE